MRINEGPRRRRLPAHVIRQVAVPSQNDEKFHDKARVNPQKKALIDAQYVS